MVRLTEQDIARFWSKVKVATPDECWEWQGHLFHNGYGAFSLCTPNAKTTVKAHRVAYILAHGEIPDGLSVCHSCDNPACCNSAHLWLGTQAENNADRDRKGRRKGPQGEHHHKAILTESDVKEIRQRYALGGVTHEQLGLEYGVHESTISRITLRLNWKHLE